MNNILFKKIGLFILSISVFLFSSCGGSKGDKSKADESEGQTELIEETPPLQVVTIDKGKLKMNQDGYSLGNDTELTELQKQLQNDTCDVVEITWIWQSKYPDMPMKISYNKLKGNLKLIYLQNNVVEEYANIFPDCLSDFLKSGEKSFYSISNYCQDSKYSFDSGELISKEAGEQPTQNELTGTVPIVKDYVKNNAYDASSIKFLEWSKVSPAGKYWIVRAKYKGTNAFGGTVTQDTWFYIQNNNVVQARNIN